MTAREFDPVLLFSCLPSFLLLLLANIASAMHSAVVSSHCAQEEEAVAAAKAEDTARATVGTATTSFASSSAQVVDRSIRF